MQAQAQETIADNVYKYTLALIEALKHNYVQYSIRGHKHFIDKGEDAHYHIARIQDLRNGKCPIDYVIETGKKYHKVIMSVNGSRSVHAFVDKKTGEVYKSASWKAPAKGVRYDLRLIKDREYILENCDWAGGYLYAK